jgi:cytochrome-b5 reductase
MALDSPTSSTGMTVSSLVMVKGEHDEDMRPYTPISLKEELGYFDLLVKTYPTGTVSSYLHSLEVGHEVGALNK